MASPQRVDRLQRAGVFGNDVPPGAVTTTLPIYYSLINSSTIPLPPRLMIGGNIFELDGCPDPDATNSRRRSSSMRPSR
jgi:hypothetical protein